MSQRVAIAILFAIAFQPSHVEAKQVKGQSGAINYTDSNDRIAYAPHGAISSLTFGLTSRVEQSCFDSRLRPTAIRLGTAATTNCAAGTDSLRLAYGYFANGNLQTQAITRAATWNQSYTYDKANRLDTFSESDTLLEDYRYDHLGNQWLDTRHASLPGNSLPKRLITGATNPFNTKNRVGTWDASGINGYDAAGNVLKIPNASRDFTYDAENRQLTAITATSSTAYSYDGEGRRVKKVYTPTSGQVETTIFIYDAQGQLAAEYSTAAATETGTRFLTADALGSTRLETDDTGAVKRCQDYLPFGEQIPKDTLGRTDTCFGAGSNSVKFTGKERDAETGLDYFGARYMSSAQGRFTSADAPFADQFPENPQSWNLYSYTRNNPLRYVDDDGRGVKEGVANWIDRTGFAFVRVVLEPDKVASDVAAGAQRLWNERGEIPGRIGQGARDFWNSSLDNKVTVGTELLLDAALAGGVARGVRGSTALTELSIGEAAPAVTEGTIAGTNVPGQVTSRSTFRKGTVQSNWDNAAGGPAGGRLCPTCGTEVKVAPGTGKRDWDVNHAPPWTKRQFPANVKRKEVIENYQEGTNLECPTCNRSRGNH